MGNATPTGHEDGHEDGYEHEHRPPRDVTGRPVALRSVDLDTFFDPRLVAVVGAGDAPGRPNTSVTQKLTAWAERRGASVHYVNPNRTEVAGRPAVPALADVGQPLDLVAILVGDPLPVVRDAVAAGRGSPSCSPPASPRRGPRGHACRPSWSGSWPGATCTSSAPTPTSTPSRPSARTCPAGPSPSSPRAATRGGPCSRARRSVSASRTGRPPATRPTSRRPTSSPTSRAWTRRVPSPATSRASRMGARSSWRPTPRRGARCPSWWSRWVGPTRGAPWPRRTPGT